MSQDINRRRVLTGIGTGVAVGLAGCAGGDEGTTTTEPTETTTTDPMETTTTEPTETSTAESASVRVAHMSPNAPNVDVYVDGDTVLEDVAFGAASSYLDVPAGDREIEITAAGDADTVVFSGPVAVEAGTAYTVVAAGELGDDANQPFEPLVLTDDNSDINEETTRVRLVHASPDAPAVDVTTPIGNTVFDGAAFGDATYVTTPEDEYTLQVRPDTEAGDGDVLGEYAVSLDGGEVYTVFAAGYLTPDDDPGGAGFQLLAAEDTGEAGTTELPTPAKARVAHLSPDIPDVSVTVDGVDIAEGVVFGDVGDYLDLTPGSHTVQVTIPERMETIGRSVTVEAGEAYTVAATGERAEDGESAELTVFGDDRSAPGESESRLRVVHASPDAPAVDVTAGGEVVLADGLAFRETATATVPANAYTAQIRPDTAGNDGDVVADFDVSLNGATGYSAFAVGYLTPDDEPADADLDLVVAQDTP